MAGFHDALAALRGEDGSLNIPDDFEGALTGAYDGDMDMSNAKIADLERQLSELNDELIRTKAANWDLVQGGTPLDGPGDETDSNPDNSANDQTDDEDGDEPDDDDGVEGFDDLFGDDDDNDK